MNELLLETGDRLLLETGPGNFLLLEDSALQEDAPGILLDSVSSGGILNYILNPINERKGQNA